MLHRERYRYRRCKINSIPHHLVFSCTVDTELTHYVKSDTINVYSLVVPME